MNAGTFEATVVEHCAAWSAKGTPEIKVKFVVENLAGEEEAIWGDIWISDKALGMARQQLKAIGFDIDHEDLGILDSNKLYLLGKKTQIEVALEEYNGQERLKVVKIGDAKPKDAAAQLSALTQGLRDVKKAGKADPATCQHKRYTRKDGVSVCKDCGKPKEDKKAAAPSPAKQPDAEVTQAAFPAIDKHPSEKGHCDGPECKLADPNKCACYCEKCDTARIPF